jgi:hypothetical protein
MKPQRRSRALLTVQVIYDRYRCGEVIIRPEYEYMDGSRKTGSSKRMALGESVAACAAEVWEFMFSGLLEMQSEAPEVALAIHADGDSWPQTLVEGFARAAAYELSMDLVPEDTGQMELWDTLVA